MKDFFRNNGLLLLIAAVLLALVTAVCTMLLGGTADPLSDLAGFLTTPIRNGISSFANWTEERYSDAFEREQLKSENEELKRQVAQLQAQARDAEAALEENKLLKEHLGLRPSQREFDEELVSITAWSSSNWESAFTISKGSSLGVEAGDCVVDEYWNLVGVVSQVGENWATVSTLIDSDLELGGMLARTGSAAILEGDFSLMGEGKLKLSFLPENSELMAGDLVTTSGRGGVYPPGLVVGHVEEVHTEASGMTQYAVIIPQTELEELKQVFVIKSFTIIE